LRSENGQPRIFTDNFGFFFEKEKLKRLLKDWMVVTREMVRGFRGFGWMVVQRKGSWKRPRGAGFGWRVLVVCSMLR